MANPKPGPPTPRVDVVGLLKGSKILAMVTGSMPSRIGYFKMQHAHLSAAFRDIRADDDPLVHRN